MRINFLVQPFSVWLFLFSSILFGADIVQEVFKPTSTERAYYQREHQGNRKPSFTPFNKNVEASLKMLAVNPQHIDQMIFSYYPVLSESKTVYQIEENLNQIRSKLDFLQGRLPTLAEANAWGGLLDQSGQKIDYKIVANATIAFQNAELIKSRIVAELSQGKTTTVDNIGAGVKSAHVYTRGVKPENYVPSSASVIPTISMVKNDLVSIAHQASEEGYKNILTLIAADKGNVNGSPFDGPKNTVYESMAYCSPNLVFVNILAALGHAYPNPGAIVFRNIEVVRKAKPKQDSTDESEPTVFENLAQPFELSFLYAPGVDLREKIEADLELSKQKKEEEINSVIAFRALSEDEGKKYLATELGKFLKVEKRRLRDLWLSVKENRDAFEAELDSVVDFIFQIAEASNTKVFILPAWGTGVFLNQVVDVYASFKRRIEKGTSIEKIIISTFDKSHEEAYDLIFGAAKL